MIVKINRSHLNELVSKLNEKNKRGGDFVVSESFAGVRVELHRGQDITTPIHTNHTSIRESWVAVNAFLVGIQW